MKNKKYFLLTSLILCLGIFSMDMHAQKKGNPEMATGYVYVKQIDGVWWWIGPDGDKFVSLGFNHIEPHLWLAPYNKEATLRKYGRDMVTEEGYFVPESKATKNWIKHVEEILVDLNFNTFGKHTHKSVPLDLYKDQVYYIASLESAPLAGWREKRGEGPMPDVFSINFREYTEKNIKELCTLHKNNRNLLGYLFTDVPSWKKKPGEDLNPVMQYPWINEIVSLGIESPGKQRWIEHLQSRYSNSMEAAKVWGLPISPAYGISWKEMARYVIWLQPADTEKAAADMLSFMPIIAEQWYGLHHELIRKYDPNHLILGDKSMIMWYYDFLTPALKKYVDVISVQAYGRWPGDGDIADKIYKNIGKPIYNGDGSYSITRPMQKEWGVKGWRTHAKDVEEVASFYKEALEGMMDKPYYIGWHHCGSLEQWDEAERGDSPMNENGFMDPYENYYETWTDVIRDVNSKAHKRHENSGIK